MEYRTLEINVAYAKDIQKVNLISKMDVYVVASIVGSADKRPTEQRTPVDRDGDTSPTWNFPMKLTVDVAGLQQNRLALVLKLRCERALGDRDIGEVHIPLKELLDAPTADGKPKFVSYQVRKPSGKPKGQLTFSYNFGDKISGPPAPAVAKVVEPVTAYPAPPHMAGPGPSAAYPPPQQAAYPPPSGYPPAGGAPTAYPQPSGYPPAGGAPTAYPQPSGYPPAGGAPTAYPQPSGYPPAGAYPPPPAADYGAYPPPPQAYGAHPPPQGYGYPPPPAYAYPQQVQQPPKKNKFGMGLGAGLLGGALGGLLIGDMVSDASSYDSGYDAGFDDGGGYDF